MTQITWDALGERIYETGVDRGVLYPKGATGVPWNGLVNVTQRSSSVEVTPQYFDGIKTRDDVANEDFAATIQAFTYPDEFEECDGTAFDGKGLSFGVQPRKLFDLTYRTRIGNDVDGIDRGYKIHIVYNALAAPNDKAYGTIASTQTPSSFSWTISTTPVKVPGRKPTAHIILDSTRMDLRTLNFIEGYLYGAQGIDPFIPSPAHLAILVGDWVLPELEDPLNFKGVILNTQEYVRNLATNPSFETSGALTTVKENLAPNPSFEDSAGNIAVKTNLALDPKMLLTGAAMNNAARNQTTRNAIVPPNNPQGFTRGLMSEPKDGGIPTVNVMSNYNMDSLVQTGPARYMGLWVYPGKAGKAYWNNDGVSKALILQPEEWVWVPSIEPVAAGAYSTFYYTTISGDAVIGEDWVYTTGVTALVGESPTQAIVGDLAPWGDFTYGWNGSANASTSGLIATIPSSVVTSTTVAYGIRSKEWAAHGTYSLRQIPLYNVRNSAFTELAGSNNPRGLEAGKTYVISVIARRAVATLASASIQVTGTSTGQNVRTDVPSGVGIFPLSLTFVVPLTGAWYLRLYNGGMLGDSDLWWDQTIITEGPKVEPYFDGSTIQKLRRNRFRNPKPAVLTGLAAIGGNLAIENDYVRTTVLTPNAGGSTIPRLQMVTEPGSAIVEPGEPYYMELEARNSKGYPLELRVWFMTSTGTYVIYHAQPKVTSGTTTWTKLTGSGVVPPNATRMGWQVIATHLTLGTVAGDTVDVRRQSTEPIYFDGSSGKVEDVNAYWEGSVNNSASYLRDFDFVAAWSGTPNASTSLLRGYSVLGVVFPVGTAAITSTRWGLSRGESLRIIPLSGGTSYGQVTIPTVIGKTYTVSATLRLITNHVLSESRGRRMMVRNGAIGTGDILSDASPGVPGVYRHSITFTAVLSNTSVFFWNGAKRDGGEVWWDAFSFTEGTEARDYFDGSSAPFVYRKQIVTPVWVGTPDGSVSQIQFYRDLPENGSPGDGYLVDGNLWILNNGIWTNFGQVPITPAPL